MTIFKQYLQNTSNSPPKVSAKTKYLKTKGRVCYTVTMTIKVTKGSLKQFLNICMEQHHTSFYEKGKRNYPL